MHFSIPDTQECSELNGSAYVGYNIHINGEYHCTLRYKQLHSLNDQLRKLYGSDNVPVFPPKKFWPLSSSQVEERRMLLEKYIQAVGQTPHLLNSEYFNAFLLTAQQESCGEKAAEVTLDVFKMNGYRIPVSIRSDESSDSALEKVCKQINLPKEYVYYFSLFLTTKDENGEFIILRKLQNFESPYLTFKGIKGSHKITLRKSCWDLDYDLELMRDRISLDLVYIQTVSDIERGWVICPNKQTQFQLTTLQATGAKEQYLELARTLKYYGHIQFKECIADYPLPDSKVIVSAGHRHLNLRFKNAKGEWREAPFRVTRMKCWRITTRNDLSKDEENGIGENGVREDDEKDESRKPQLELAFEYLMTRDNLQWVTLTTDQAILISVCLQSIVDELLIQKSGSTIKQPAESLQPQGLVSYMRRDGSSLLISISQSSSSSDTLSHSTSDSRSPPLESSMSMRRLSEKLKNSHDPFVENDAFEGIGDDDL